MIDFNYLEIKEFYSYRTAIVSGIKIEDKTISETVRKFVTENGYKMDNHICFTTNNDLAFMYSDRCLYIGTHVIKRNW